MGIRNATGWRQQFGERLVTAMQRAGLTQRALGERVGVTEGAVSRWVNGRTDPDLPLLPRLAAVLGVTLDWLLGSPSAPGPPQGPQRVDVRKVRRVVKRLRDVAAAAEDLAALLPEEDER